MRDKGIKITIDEEDFAPVKEMVNHPTHYGGAENQYEAIKVIEAWDLGFCLGNTIKYISRAGKKDNIVQELEKALWYLDREINKQKGYEKEKGTKTGTASTGSPTTGTRL